MIPESDGYRVAALQRYGILDTPKEDTFDIITSMVSEMLSVPHACVSLVAEERVWFKSAFGVEAEQVDREPGFCSSLVKSSEDVRHIEDASKHPETLNNSLTCGPPNIRFYAGAPLCTPEGYRIGTLCAFGPKPRGLTPTERISLRNLSVLVMHEIELRRAQQELQRTEEALNQSQRLESVGMVASGVAHDFNNLLGGILGAAELLRGELDEHRIGNELIEEILTTGKRAADLAGQVLAYAGHSAQSPFLPSDLNALVRETHRMLSTSLATRVPIHLSLAENLPAVRGQSTGLRQVVMNLLTNASEACATNEGQIWLKTLPSQDGQHVLLTVTDSGPGMTEETVRRIFEPFFSSKTGSRGLGLAICGRILEQHDATIDVESKVGYGTTFRIKLPATTDQTAPENPKELSAQAPDSKGRILVVDDEKVICEVARRCLKKSGYEVTVAYGGAEALEILAQSSSPYDALLLDWNMPEVDGVQVMDQLRQDGSTLPIILSSGHTKQAAQQRISDHTIHHFLKKPFRLDELLGAVQEAMGG